MFGYSKSEMSGKNVAMLMPPPFSMQHHTFLRSYKQMQKGNLLGTGPREVIGAHKDGYVFPVKVTIEKSVGADGYTGVFYEVSFVVLALVKEFCIDSDWLMFRLILKSSLTRLGWQLIVCVMLADTFRSTSRNCLDLWGRTALLCQQRLHVSPWLLVSGLEKEHSLHWYVTTSLTQLLPLQLVSIVALAAQPFHQQHTELQVPMRVLKSSLYLLTRSALISLL